VWLCVTGWAGGGLHGKFFRRYADERTVWLLAYANRRLGNYRGIVGNLSFSLETLEFR
jgi:hypothetical protein